MSVCLSHAVSGGFVICLLHHYFERESVGLLTWWCGGGCCCCWWWRRWWCWGELSADCDGCWWWWWLRGLVVVAATVVALAEVVEAVVDVEGPGLLRKRAKAPRKPSVLLLSGPFSNKIHPQNGSLTGIPRFLFRFKKHQSIANEGFTTNTLHYTALPMINCFIISLISCQFNSLVISYWYFCSYYCESHSTHIRHRVLGTRQWRLCSIIYFLFRFGPIFHNDTRTFTRFEAVNKSRGSSGGVGEILRVCGREIGEGRDELINLISPFIESIGRVVSFQHVNKSGQKDRETTHGCKGGGGG